MRASIAAESAGIPSVSIVCEGFDGQALATARGLGYDGLPVALIDGHVDAQSADELAERFLASTVDRIVAGLVVDHDVDDVDDVRADPADPAAPTSEHEPNREPAAPDVVLSGTIDEINDEFAARGWSDGSPVIPPTPERIDAFLDGSGHDPWKRLAIAPASGRDMTVWSIAVNAVMAGCRPEHLPILIAIAEVLADPAYGAEHSGNTTGADALVVLDGPSSATLGFESGAGVQREGVHANTSVGRWLRLYLRNVVGITTGEHDKATFGNPARPVLATNGRCASEIGWPTVGEQLGGRDGGDTVSMARMNSGILVGSVFGSTPDEIVPYLANGIARAAGWDLTHVYGLGHDQYQPLLVVSPLLARTFARAGWTFDRVRAALFEHARIPAATFERFVGEWTNLTAGRRRLVDLVAEGALPAVFAESDDPERPVPVVTRPERILIAVAGDPTRANAYVFSNDGPHGWWTVKTIDRTPATDLTCKL